MVTELRNERYQVVPQLREVAAWLATMRRDVFDALVVDNPGVLLASDVGVQGTEKRSQLVGSLLGAIESGLEHDIWKDFRRHYHKLAYAGLTDQLRPLIVDRSRNFIARRVAIEVAEACKLSEVRNEVLRVAVDSAERDELRSHAIWALVDCGDSASKASIKAWLLAPSGRAASDELRGEALRLLWPGTMSATELFSVLTPPHQEHHFGTYQSFLSTAVVPALSTEDLPLALEWCERCPNAPGTALSIERLTDQIFWKAWEQIEVPYVTNPLAHAVLARLRTRYRLVLAGGFDEISDRLAKEFADNSDRRRLLLLALLPHLGDDIHEPIVLLQTCVVRTDDLEWLVLQLRTTTDRAIEAKLAILVGLVFNPLDSRQFGVIYEESARCPALAKEVEGSWNPVQLDSPTADSLRERYREHLAVEERARLLDAQMRPELDIEKLVNDELVRFGAGDFDAWWRINRLLSYGPNGGPHFIQGDLRRLPGWNALTEAAKQKVIDTAPIYLERGDPRTADWLGTNELHYQPLAGYSALHLLKEVAPEKFAALPVAVWARWAPAVLSFPAFDDERKTQRELLGATYSHAPAGVVDAVIYIIDASKGNQPNRISLILEVLSGCTGEPLWSALLNVLCEIDLPSEQAGYLLSMLLEGGSPQARKYALGLIADPLPIEPDPRQLALVAARELMLHGDYMVWPDLWRAFQSDSEFGKSVMLSSCWSSRDDYPSVLADLNENDLADLFIWLETHFPRCLDPDHGAEAHVLGPRDSIVFLREGILARLKAKGSDAACIAIEKIKIAFSHLDWLQVLLIDARENARRASWNPPDPGEFLDLLRSSESRLVRDGNELLLAIRESLFRLQAKLKAETPSARFLWDESVRQPKDESALSDYIKTFLDDDLKRHGIFAAREVEIYPSKRGRGASTDIHVDAFALHGHEHFDRFKGDH